MAAWGGETCLTEQVAPAALAVNNFQELFKPPETTWSNHQRAFNAAAKPLTSTKKQESSSRFRRKISIPSCQARSDGGRELVVSQSIYHVGFGKRADVFAFAGDVNSSHLGIGGFS